MIHFHSPAPTNWRTFSKELHHGNSNRFQNQAETTSSFTCSICGQVFITLDNSYLEEPQMTPKQKSQHITNIRAILTSSGLTKDRWGNYRLRSKGTNYRIKLMTNNCRCERKSTIQNNHWLTVWSIPIIRLELTQLTNWLNSHPLNK